jgi:mono/diheme cytochrome c family protein
MSNASPSRSLLLALAVTAALTGCRQDMHDQPRYRPLADSSFFPDGRASRPLVAGTIARGHLKADSRYFAGKQGNEFVNELPVQLTRDLLVRGQQRYDIFCAPCHGRAGDGEGMVVQRGFRHPPSFHQERLHNQALGHFYDVITNGFGAMSSYASRIPVADRWAIVAYIRALQLSQNATIEDVPAAERTALQAAGGQQQ